jgi:recombination protein RecT
MANEIETKKPGSRLSFYLSTENVKATIQERLSKKAQGFTASLLSLYNSNKQLQDCEPGSIVNAGMIAATLDLPVNPNLGQAYIIPYGTVATFQMGYRGFIQLALRTGQYKTINATEIYEGQLVEKNSITGDYKFQEAKTSEKIIGYCAYFRLLNGFEKYNYMTSEEVEKHGKRYSQVYKAGKGRWVEDFPGMAKKTVLKMLLNKYGVLSIEMQKALSTDEGVIDVEGKEVNYPDAPVEEPITEAQTTSKRLKEAVESNPTEDEKATKERLKKQATSLIIAGIIDFTSADELTEWWNKQPEHTKAEPELKEAYNVKWKALKGK